ncbi:MAG TPA: hypothetical protein DCE41_30300 [Cytophagales bacterium]|nr:hypothetical protein [Cytophagales bacterium]HAA20390.1 hypothetical protein [Cytophagales bacterium]HAP62136.1 hypothetical protein [Cytophagales bacterium]
MKIHRKTFRVFDEGERELVYEDVMDETGNMLSYKDYQASYQAEGNYEYDTKGLLICDREYTGGAESSRTEYIYNENGDNVSTKLFVAGELFEETVYEYLEQGMVYRIVQQGEEIQRHVESDGGNQFVKDFFEEGELIQRQTGTYDPVSRTQQIKILNEENQVVSIQTHQYDSEGNLLKFEQTNNKGKLMSVAEYEYENNRMLVEKHDNYLTNQHYEMTCEYDTQGNLVSTEYRTPAGKLMEYQKAIFDGQNRLVSESGYSVGSFDAIYGAYVQGQNYHFEHEYEEI